MPSSVTSPLVSVVIPTHNRADLLGNAIESAMRQEGGPFNDPGALEVIVVDDASTDQTRQVVARYEPGVVSLRNVHNRERGASRNVGAAAARGSWLAFLDSDDEWEDGKLAAQMELVGSHAACVTDRWLMSADGGLLGLGRAERSPSTAEIDLINPFSAAPSSLLIDRDLFIRLGGFPEDPAVQGSEDWLLMAKLLHAGCDPMHVHKPLVRYRVHADNSTASPDAYLRSGLAAIDWLGRYGITTTERAKIARGRKYETVARAYALHGEFTLAFRCLMIAVSSAPVGRRLATLGNTAEAAIRAAAHRTPERWFSSARQV